MGVEERPGGGAFGEALRRGTGGAGRSLTVSVLLILLTLAVFSPVFRAAFLNYDDNIYVTENRHVLAGLTWRGLGWALTSVDFNWHPLTWWSHMLDVELFGPRPGAHHAMNLLYHSLNVLLLFHALVRLTGAFWRAAAVAALFAVHPLHVEPVAWIAARKDLLSTFFWFAGVVAYAGYVKRRTVFRYAAVAACLCLGLMSKGMIVTFPLVLLALDFWPLRRWRPWRGGGESLGDLAAEKLPLFAICLVGAATQVVAQHARGALRSLEELPPLLRAANALVGYAAYLGKMVWPFGLAVPYPLRGGFPPLPDLVVSGLVLLVVTGFVGWTARRRPYLAVGWFWYLVTLLPVIGLVQIANQAMADRYTYVPLVGVFVAVVWGAADLARGRPWLREPLRRGALVALLGLGAIAWNQAGYWRDSVTLFSHTIEVTRNNLIAENNLGGALGRVGRHEEARRHYLEALRINPGHISTLNNLAILYVGERDFARAEELLGRALERDPMNFASRMNLGVARLEAGDTAGAVEQFHAAADLQPSNGRPYLGLATAAEQAGDLAEAAAWYERALGLEPDLEDAHTGYGRVLEAQGLGESAILQYKEELRYRPGHAEASERLHAALEAVGGDALAGEAADGASEALLRNAQGVAQARAGDVKAAEESFRAALRLNPNLALAELNLGLCRLRENDPERAQKHFERVVEMEPGNAFGHLGIAEALDMRGKLRDSVPHYERCVALDPNLREARMRFALVLEALGLRDKSAEQLREVLRIDPGNKPALLVLERLGAVP